MCTLGFQLGAKFRIVIDLAVEHDDQAAVRADHRLIGAFGQIHDRQPAMAEAAAAIRIPPEACTIGPAGAHGLARGEQFRLLRQIGGRVIGEDAVYPAHMIRKRLNKYLVRLKGY